MTPDRRPWWEGIGTEPPPGLIDWRGRPWRAEYGKAAHPNSRFTSPARQCPCISPRFDDPQGVPISAIVFGGRRARVAPLVFEARDWQHGVFVGATMGSETTAAATGAVGVLRRDPMAMLPFCGYNMGDYFGHWLAMGRKLSRPPAIFHVNWFRTDAAGRYLWPGFGENFRVLDWIIRRTRGDAPACETPIGNVPTSDGFNLAPEAVAELLTVDRAAWTTENAAQQEFLHRFGDRLPPELTEERVALGDRLARVVG
jgi:phosphoenolpyruvate carboxykinase (GTP)